MSKKIVIFGVCMIFLLIFIGVFILGNSSVSGRVVGGVEEEVASDLTNQRFINIGVPIILLDKQL